MSASRLAKLQAMADPARNDNPHERAVAQAEIERLRAADTTNQKPVLTWVDVGRSRTVEEFTERYAEMLRREEREERERRGALDEILRGVAAARARQARGILFPGEEGYRAWASGLGVGARVRTHWTHWPEFTFGPVITVVRQTLTQHVMSDGSRYRRTGYKVGENGRDGRHYLVHEDAGE